MKNIFIATLFIGILPFNFAQKQIQKKYKVSFEVTAQSFKEDLNIFIAGNKFELGNWKSDSISLIKKNDSTFEKHFIFNEGELLEFKFTKGSWNKEAIFIKGAVPSNFKLIVSSDTTLKIKIPFWKDGEEFVLKGQITGQVKYHKNFNGIGILPRDIVVWLPPNYFKNDKQRFPVLYMHDGQNLFDPKTSAFGIDWQVDESADSLIKNNFIDDIIIVGIYNTSERRTEYINSDAGINYMKFIVHTLKPFIDKNYKTLADKKNTAIAGSSLGGLISFMLIWEYSDIFSFAGCFSPAFKIDKIDFVSTVKSYSGDKKKIKLYIDNGGIGLETLLQLGIDEMINTLNEKGFKSGTDYLYFIDKEAEHNESAWAKRVPKFLEFCLRKN